MRGLLWTHLVMTDTYVVFTNDDAGMQEPELFAELLDFLAVQEVPATFFTVPSAEGRPLDEKPRWMELLYRAVDQGHELQQHGWIHTPFEFGVPPPIVRQPERRAKWLRRRSRSAADHSYEALIRRLDQGRSVLQRSLGYTPLGFRSPYLATCDNMYRALHDLGFQWSSNQVINPMGWRYIDRDFDAGDDWDVDVPAHPYQHSSGIVEVPMHSEYTWFLDDSDIERHFQLARSDFDRAQHGEGVFVVLSHYYALTGRWAAGMRVYERLFDHVRQHGNARFVTLSDLIDRRGSAHQGSDSPP